MKYSKWVGLIAVITVIICAYMPWITVPDADLVVGGMSSTGKHNFGRPGLMNIILSVMAALFFLLPYIWAKRTNIFFCGFNIAWTVRNLMLLGRCYGGECPAKQPALYIVVAASVVMLVMAFLPDISVEPEENQKRSQPDVNEI